MKEDSEYWSLNPNESNFCSGLRNGIKNLEIKSGQILYILVKAIILLFYICQI